MTRVYEGGRQFQIKITGADHVDLLHRIISNDVRGLAVGCENYQCLLTVQGKIIAPFRLRRESDYVTIIGPAELKATICNTIEKYIFAEDARIESQPDIELPDDDDARIRAGLIRWGVDIDEDTIPWEAGMSEYVSTSKGCYTGQETIARIETYGRVAWRLMRLTADAPAERELLRDGKVVGSITSVTSLPPYEALGMVRREVAAGDMVGGWVVSEL